ncbi:MAG: glycosyltransferase [Planctomycetota bacterium]
MLSGRDIVILASAGWDHVGRLNCHHVARRLAARNRVLFVDSTGLRLPSLLHRTDAQKVLRRLRGWLGCALKGPWQAAPRLHVLSPAAFPLRSVRWAERLSTSLLGNACRRALRRLGFQQPVFWAFLPSAVWMLGRLGECAVVYHCVDDYAGNPGVDAGRVEEDERRLAAAADLCLATSRPLADRLSRLGANVACVPNAAETERFGRVPGALPADLDSLPPPRVGYVGNIASYKTDLELVAEVARRRPGWSLVLVGPTGSGDPSTSVDGLARLPNVHLLGPRSYERVAAYVHGLDVCLIPFRRSRVTDSSLPLKTFEYLAAGKPVVATPLPSLLAEPLGGAVTYAAGPQEFIRAIERHLADGDAGRQARQAVAARYCWAKRFCQIESRVSDILAQKEVQGGHDLDSRRAAQAH